MQKYKYYGNGYIIIYSRSKWIKTLGKSLFYELLNNGKIKEVKIWIIQLINMH